MENKTMVGWDCRPGDVIKIEDRNWRVTDTFPGGVIAENNDEDRRFWPYERLRDRGAYYVAQVQVFGPAGQLLR